MTSTGRDRCSQQSVIDLPASWGPGASNLDHYLLSSTQQLDAIAQDFSRDEAIGADSRTWMLAQVDFIVDIIGDETLELTSEVRSNLLQLLLAIANLNEQIRRQAPLHV